MNHQTKDAVATEVHSVSRPTIVRNSRHLWSIDIDAVTMESAVARIRSWIADGGGDCRFVVTPNVDHIVQLYRRPELTQMYNQSSLTLADGWPLVTMSRFYGKALPERVAGSDLLPALCGTCHSCNENLRVYLLGGQTGVPERAAANIQSRWPNVSVVGSCSPPFGFERDAELNAELCKQVNESRPDVLVVGLGFPKQELWIGDNRHRLSVPVALAVGGTIDFLAGEQTRAPKWVQSIRLEWLHRLATNPRRLAKRYAQDAAYFPWICLREFVSKREI